MKTSDIQKAFDRLTAKYQYALEKLEDAYERLETKPDVIETPSTGDLTTAASLLAQSDFNKEDLSEKEILKILQQQSEQVTLNKAGFWAMPLPVDTDDTANVNTRYIGKRR